jgi:hypothetical protein
MRGAESAAMTPHQVLFVFVEAIFPQVQAAGLRRASLSALWVNAVNCTL